jgi:hypothetical protein
MRISMLTAIALLTTACAVPAPAEQVRPIDNGIEFGATVHAADFSGGDMAGYHLVVWSDGRAADQALLRADVSDLQVIDALEALGADPGDALRIDSWDDRYEVASTAPDRVIEGPRVRVEILLPDRAAPLTLDQILEDPAGRGFDLRFGGHRDNIPEWHSGCVVCLYSCPGSKVGNASYTVRDFVLGTTHFAPKAGVLPPDGTPVTVRLLLETS